MSADQRAGGLASALERVSTELDERRTPLAVLVAVIAVLMTYRGVHGSTHSFAAFGVAMLLVARAIALGRAFLGRHLAASVALLVAARAADTGEHVLVAWLAVAAAGAVAGLPRRPPPPAEPSDRRHVWALVDGTSGDTLAPFVLRTDKTYVFSPDRRAAVAYRVKLGTAIASGDPVGEPSSYPAAVEAFVAHADAQGWRVAVLGAGPRSLPLWRRQGLWAVSIGRDVRIDVASFSLEGRRFRNLRQAVQRSRNAGVTTDVVGERDLDDDVRAELLKVMAAAGKGTQTRGFAMILDEPLTGVHPGMYIAYARSASGQIVAFHRYASADGGRELSLDVPWRRPGAPNGVDERLIVEMVRWGAARGARSLSLAFAAFPDVFELQQRSILQQLAYRAVHLLDRFIRLESLYRFVRKFHAFGDERYVALRPIQLVFVAATALSLEFGAPQKRRRD
ncbi:MAG TPA: phosphatidylglycerol lysyltransferase domain-containing protein [Mycobacteriales bacterium]|nr:phosphatidylglycerol lysyltransferase domain-containing protein [Mycobacteriales bacterium]